VGHRRVILRGRAGASPASLRLGIVLNHTVDYDAAAVIRHACGMGLEDIVSERPSALRDPSLN
jgi:hypothetical protein